MIGGYVGGIGVPLHVGDGITAILDITEDADTLTSSAVLALKASLDVTEGDGTRASLGLLHIAASAGLVEDSDTASGSLASLAIIASLDCTEEDDTLTATIRFDDVLVTVLRPRVSNITLSRSSPYQITSARPNYSVITA